MAPDDSDEPDTDDAIVAAVSDYCDGVLAEAERASVAERIASDPAWRQVHDELRAQQQALRGLAPAPAPPQFAATVTETIHRRSAGRFFARRTLGDRVPLGVLLVVALVLLVAVAAILWSSTTGSLRLGGEGTPPTPATDLVPRSLAPR